MVIASRPHDPKLETLVESIVDRVRPELVLLFGSRATGGAREDSDYDLLVVVHDGEDPEEIRAASNEIRSRLNLPVDVLASTVSQYARRQHDPGFLEWLVSREGKVMYTSGLIPQRSAAVDRVRERPREGMDHWIARAEGDWRAARASGEAEDPPWASIAFLSHACIEKLLKATIVMAGRYPPRTHALPELLCAMSSGGDDPDLVEACDVLHALYPKSRYHPYPMPTADEGRRALAAAEKARGRLRRT